MMRWLIKWWVRVIRAMYCRQQSAIHFIPQEISLRTNSLYATVVSRFRDKSLASSCGSVYKICDSTGIRDPSSIPCQLSAVAKFLPLHYYYFSRYKLKLPEDHKILYKCITSALLWSTRNLAHELRVLLASSARSSEDSNWIPSWASNFESGNWNSHNFYLCANAQTLYELKG